MGRGRSAEASGLAMAPQAPFPGPLARPALVPGATPAPASLVALRAPASGCRLLTRPLLSALTPTFGWPAAPEMSEAPGERPSGRAHRWTPTFPGDWSPRGTGG